LAYEAPIALTHFYFCERYEPFLMLRTSVSNVSSEFRYHE